MTKTEKRVELMPSQDRFVFSAKRYPFFVAGIGSGKTMAGAIRSALFAKKGDGMILAPTYPMLRDATQHTFFELLDEAAISYEFNKGDQEAILFGHRILFRSADHPERLRGTNLTWAWLDEGAMMRSSVWDIVLGRLRIGDRTAFVTTTPAGFNWVYDRANGDRDEYEFIRARTQDNVHLPTDYVQDLTATYTGEFAAQELEGEFVAFEGLIYSDFRQGVHISEAEPKGQKVCAIDFGYTNPFVALWGSVDEDGRLHIYDEHYKRRELMEYHAEQILSRGECEWYVADHDAQDVAELRAYDIPTAPAKKAVLAGIQKVMSRLIVQPDGRPRLTIHPRCVNLLREIGTYRWREQSSKEEPVKENDHAMDALRYMVMQLETAAPRISVL